MPHPKFHLYKHIKISGKWRYCRAAIYSNGKVKPHVVVVGAQEEKHEEGSTVIRHKNSWIEAGTDPLAAQRRRSKHDDQTAFSRDHRVGPHALQEQALTPFSCSGAVQKKEHRDGLCASVSPGVSRTILHNHIAALQLQRLAVVQLQPNLSVVDNRVVDRVRPVHSGIFFFEVIG